MSKNYISAYSTTSHYCYKQEQQGGALRAVFRIHDVLERLRILLFSSMTFKMPIGSKFFFLITYLRYIYISFQR
jgi:hypothetical protein